MTVIHRAEQSSPSQLRWTPLNQLILIARNIDPDK
ncbi:hypothetical protein ENKNEFLB_02853 [Nocardioides aquaticus]|uniref:Uncharacterized protein n=1 Tax=Nocardioides aquaticus TaxID=160826 RepID=A0ABX8EIW5_9ACTN|nr:hypothetical protein ENKNEFLB_02853 [Nocardioides aquaticus]